MRDLRHYLFVRHRHNWALLAKFVIVGGSGFIVNLAVFTALLHLGSTGSVLVDLPATEFNVRGYHLFSTLAFLVANLSNFQLNRRWTFASHGHASWLSEYGPFFAIGVVAQAVALLLLTAFVHPDSPVQLPGSIFDGSMLLLRRLLWAQALTVVLVTPISFVGNKVWTFRAVRGHGSGGSSSRSSLDATVDAPLDTPRGA